MLASILSLWLFSCLKPFLHAVRRTRKCWPSLYEEQACFAFRCRLAKVSAVQHMLSEMAATGRSSVVSANSALRETAWNLCCFYILLWRVDSVVNKPKVKPQRRSVENIAVLIMTCATWNWTCFKTLCCEIPVFFWSPGHWIILNRYAKHWQIC